MTSDRPRCSAESIARGEPLFATASLVSAWLMIEQPGAWGPDALFESDFPTEIAEELQQRVGAVRLLLIRHREKAEGEPACFMAHSGDGRTPPILVKAPMHDPADLLEVDFEALAGGEPGPGTPVEHPLYLVCTHGRHDLCCADKGRPLYRAMSELRPDQTWEASHLGGDRFAGNLLVLPRGDYFGRLEPGDAKRLVEDYEADRLDLAHHRGRSTLPRLAQAAEHFAREAEGLTGIGDLELTAYHRPEHDRAEVSFAGPGGAIHVEVTVTRRSERDYLTCRAEDRGEILSYDLVSLERAPLD